MKAFEDTLENYGTFHALQFDTGVSPIEFRRPDDLMEIVERISRKV
ncbi:DUF3898 domain-containing protein [Peribacillus frigoritolerans]